MTENNQEDGAQGGTNGEVGEAPSSPDPDDLRYERRWSKRDKGPHGAVALEPDVQGASPPNEGAVHAEVEKQKQRADDLYERLQRAMADLSNYRRRTEQEREEMAKFAAMFLIVELLPVLDNFERALETIPRSLEGFTWLQGIMLIERHLRAILERHGVQPIEAVGQPFNASWHEAIVEEASEEHQVGTVMAELQRGYTMHGQVLRPTLAKVARAPKAEPDASSAEHSDPSEAESEPKSPASPDAGTPGAAPETIGTNPDVTGD